jgi:hypothetical protein
MTLHETRYRIFSHGCCRYPKLGHREPGLILGLQSRTAVSGPVTCGVAVDDSVNEQSAARREESLCSDNGKIAGMLYSRG